MDEKEIEEILDDLIEDGYVEIIGQDEDGKNLYSLTKRGEVMGFKLFNGLKNINFNEAL